MKVLFPVFIVAECLLEFLAVGLLSLHRERYFVPVECLLDEDGDCAGHGEAHAAEKLLCAALGFVVDPEIYLCHGSLSPLRLLLALYQMPDSNVNGMLYNTGASQCLAFVLSKLARRFSTRGLQSVRQMLGIGETALGGNLNNLARGC